MAQVQRATTKVRKGRPVSTTTKTKSPAPASDVLSRISTPGSVQNLKGLLFGPPKTGKTRGVCSSSGKTLLVLTEPEGDLGISGQKNVDVFRPQNWKDLNDVTIAMKGKDHGYDCVAYDSVTFMFELVGGADVAKAFRENKDVRRPYGNAGAAINQIVYNAASLDMNVMFTAQLKVEDGGDDGDSVPLDPTEGEYPVTVAITPMIYKVLVPAVSFIGRTYKEVGYEQVGNKPNKEKVVRYMVSFEDYGRSPASSRVANTPNQVRDLNLDTLLAELKGEN